ncbi:MAG TPA: alpha/beta fold hydrolase [Gemmatimonadales bacterium]|nr:alpha/beta fold hydrolase [Gemmatimonadales bacterium]
MALSPSPSDPRVRALRLAFRTVGTVAPAAAARVAERIFCNPPASSVRPHEEAFLAAGRRFTIAAAGHRFAAWEWGAGPTVLAVHGWGSVAARFHVLAPALVAAGHRVVAYDGPAHGRSSGRLASLPAFARALEAVGRELGPLAGVVGHSLGGAAIALALRLGLRAERAVLVAPPASPVTYVNHFVDLLAIPHATRRRLQTRIERRYAIPWADLHVPTVARGLAVPALVVHDRGDPDVPWHDGAAIAEAWPGAELVTTEGLGHRAILRDAAVARRVTAFLAA